MRKRKLLFGCFICFTLLLSAFQICNASETIELLIDCNYSIIDGQIKQIDELNEDITPIIIDDRTLVPVRFISESFGMSVDWDSKNKIVKLTNSDFIIEIPIGLHEYSVNSIAQPLDVPATIINDRTMLPLRAMAETINKKVYWNNGYIYIGNYEFSNEDSIESHKWQMTHGSNEYGVRFKEVNDDEDYYAECERLGAAINMNAVAQTPELNGYSDFDIHYPWSDIRLCSLQKSADGRTIVKYENEEGFNKDNGEIFVEIPKFYMRRYIEDGYEYRFISQFPKEGYFVDPSFIEDGKELDFIYVSAYEGGNGSNKLVSRPEVYPMIEKNRRELIDFAKEKGIGYGILDLRTLLTIQNLYLIEYADKNSQETIGNGWTMCLQPAKNIKSHLNEDNTNRVVVSTKYISRLFPGCSLLILNGENNRTIYQRTITKIVNNEYAEGTSSIYFDGEPVKITIDMYIGSGPQKTGSTDAVSYHTGRTEGHGSDTYSMYRTGVKYRNMENLWGNLWHYLDGINIKNGKTYFSLNMREYNLNSENYLTHNIEQKIQTDNASVGGANEIRYLKNLGYDENYPWLALPCEYMNEGVDEIEGASSLLRSNSFGDYYYLNTTSTNYVHGGGFDHYWRCGLFTMRGWQGDSHAWYLYGSRLIYKPIDF